MLSNVWIIPWSVSKHCCFDSSVIVFEEPVTEMQAKEHVDYSKEIDKRVEHRNVMELMDCTPEEEASILAALRKVF